MVHRSAVRGASCLLFLSLLAGCLGLPVDTTTDAVEGEHPPGGAIPSRFEPFTAHPRVVMDGDGSPMDRFRLEVCGVQREPPIRAQDDRSWTRVTIVLAVREKHVEDGDLGPDFANLDDWYVELPDSVDVFGSKSSASTWPWWEFTRRMSPRFKIMATIPSDLQRIPRLEVDLRVAPVGEPVVEEFEVARGERLDVTFLERNLFVITEPGIEWGAHTRWRFEEPTTSPETCQGRWESTEVFGADGSEVFGITSGRTWGDTIWGPSADAASALFPLRVRTTYRKCGPTTLWRFVLGDIPLPD